MLILLGALCAQISVNALNEYHDFKSGLDSLTLKTPFSGGSGALQQYPQAATLVKWFGIGSFVATVLVGVILLPNAGIELAAIGVFGLVLVITYTPWLNRSPLLCLIAPGTGFGLLMVLGTYWVLAGVPSWQVLLVALVPFFLVNNILLLNQYPDISADRSVGRRTLPTVFGTDIASIVYTVFALLAYIIVIILVALNFLPLIALLIIVSAILSLWAIKGAFMFGEAIVGQPRYLAASVNAALLAIGVMALSLWLA